MVGMFGGVKLGGGGGKVGGGRFRIRIRKKARTPVLPFAPRSSLWFTLFHVIGVLVFTD